MEPALNDSPSHTAVAPAQNGVGYDTYCWTGKTGEEFFEDPTWDDKWTKNFGESLANDISVGIGEGFFLWMNPSLDAKSATATFTK